jgi:hypothetical protein
MRANITVARHRTSVSSYLVGADAIAILSSIEGISAVQLDSQYIDGATLSYECGDRFHNFDRIDQMLDAKGMRRV